MSKRKHKYTAALHDNIPHRYYYCDRDVIFDKCNEILYSSTHTYIHIITYETSARIQRIRFIGSRIDIIRSTQVHGTSEKF